MSEPFEFLDEEEDVNDKTGGIAWLPTSLAAVALTGFLSIPVLGLLKPKKSGSNWSQYEQAEATEVNLKSEIPVTAHNPLLTPDPGDLTHDLVSVDETLANLGSNYVPVVVVPEKKERGNFFSVERKASSFIKGSSKKTKPAKGKKSDPVAVKRPQVALTPTSKTAKRTVSTREPASRSVAMKAARPSHDVIVQPGDTIYGISRRANSTPGEIARINRIKPDSTVKPGQVLRVPGYAAVRPPLLDKPAAPVVVRPTNRVAIKPDYKTVSGPTKPEPVAPRIVTARSRPAQTVVRQKPVLTPVETPVVYPTRVPSRPGTIVQQAPAPVSRPYPTQVRARPQPPVQRPVPQPQTTTVQRVNRPQTTVQRPVPQPQTTTVQRVNRPQTIVQRPVPQPQTTTVQRTVPNSPVLYRTPIQRPSSYEIKAQTKDVNPLDKWGHVIAYRIQSFDNLNKIADAHATTPEEIIKLNGRTSTKKGEMLVVPVDNCLLKSDY